MEEKRKHSCAARKVIIMGKFQSQILGATQSAARAAIGTTIAGQQFEAGVKETVKEFQDYVAETTTDIPAEDFNVYVKGAGYKEDIDIAEELEDKEIPKGGYSQADYIRAYAKTIGEIQMRNLQDFGKRIISNYQHLKIGRKGGRK